MSRGLTWLLAGAALSLSANGAFAAEPAPAPAAKSWTKEHGDNAGHAGPDRHVLRHGHRAEHLSAILQLRPEQEPALKTYLEAVKPRHEHTGGFGHAGEQGSTLARLDRMEARMAEHQAAMRARIAATRTFYATLDERQRRAFDEMPMMMFAGPGFGPLPLGPMAAMPRMPKMRHSHGEPLPRTGPADPATPAPPRAPR